MWETGKTSQMVTEMRRYNLAVLGISETHWTQAGHKKLATGEILLYSGHEKENILKYNTKNTNPITLDGETLEDVESFTYLGSIIDEQGGSDADVKARIGKARTEFLQLKNIWNSKQLSTNIKVRIFNTNTKAVPLYGTETWRTTTTTIKKVQVFINSCLRKILNIHWPATINNRFRHDFCFFPLYD
ncbi:unnamed protein product [Schistosoma margrebowiei]|uniref:Uncharacterized protein n=1 Tax=Schistosoma margrebowiei TaxID=48269 RepID=A0A183MIZ2_9TREM|nr:unnamed protein product [Schistosoma margrebowiei]